MVEIVRDVNANDWHKFLLSQRDATLYHTPEWKAFLERTFGYKSHYIFATDDSGQLSGILPLFRIQSRLTGNRLCSVPFSHKCGCLGDSFTRTALINEAIALKDGQIKVIEIRRSVVHPMFQETNAFCTHTLHLSQNPEETWKQLDKGGVRWAIKKAEKLGVSVAPSKDIEDLKEFYELNCITKQDVGVPCHPWKFFKNLFSILEDYVQIYISQHGKDIIGGGVMEYYKDQVLYGYGAADPKRLNLHPYNAFLWKSIEDACVRGFRTYDFGRTSYSNAGLIQFKKNWGTREMELCYSHYPASDISTVTDRDSTIYRLGGAVIRAMPTPVYKTFSASVFPHFG